MIFWINKCKLAETQLTINQTIIHDNEEEPYLLLDVAISRDRNVIKKEPGKILKYKHLTREIQCMCSTKTVTPVIIGEIGNTSKTFRQLFYYF